MDDSLLLDSWDRQAKIVNDLAGLVTDKNRNVQPAAESWPIARHFAHIHQTRRFWLNMFSKPHQESLSDAFVKVGETWQPIEDFEEIKRQLSLSAKAVRDAAANALKGGPFSQYEHPIYFIQHMVWHEGWHVGLIMLGLRNAGDEPPEEWEDKHLWVPWRGVEEWS